MRLRSIDYKRDFIRKIQVISASYYKQHILAIIYIFESGVATSAGKKEVYNDRRKVCVGEHIKQGFHAQMTRRKLYPDNVQR